MSVVLLDLRFGNTVLAKDSSAFWIFDQDRIAGTGYLEPKGV
jgi:hypothetical protein